jgi:hypothetical protein
VLKKELIQHLRSKRRIRRSRQSRVSGHRSGQIVDAISMRERPAEIEDRAIPGHWEGDLIGGTKNSHIATLVERHSRFTALVKVRSKDTATLSVHIEKQSRFVWVFRGAKDARTGIERGSNHCHFSLLESGSLGIRRQKRMASGALQTQGKSGNSWIGQSVFFRCFIL